MALLRLYRRSPVLGVLVLALGLYVIAMAAWVALGHRPSFAAGAVTFTAVGLELGLLLASSVLAADGK